MITQRALLVTVAALTFVLPGCDQSEPAQETATPATQENAASAALQSGRADETAQMEQRVAELERRWSEVQSRAAADSARATAGLREEVREDVTNVRQAVEDLKTTTLENWWERDQRTLERTADDIQEDVRRISGRDVPAPMPSPETQTTPQGSLFESSREQFVTRMQGRVEAMSNTLQNVNASGAQATELADTRARLDKLREDVERLRGASSDEWWEISSARVSEYIDRVEDSLRRLEENRS